MIAEGRRMLAVLSLDMGSSTDGEVPGRWVTSKLSTLTVLAKVNTATVIW